MTTLAHQIVGFNAKPVSITPVIKTASAVAIVGIAMVFAVVEFSQARFTPTNDVEMTIADLTFVAFTFCNSLRVLAYIPQITKAIRDQSGAEAISFWTWGLFLAANVSAIAYAVENKADWMMASMFLGNGLGCGAFLLIAAWKRSLHRGNGSRDRSAIHHRRHRLDSCRSSGWRHFSRGSRSLMGDPKATQD